MKKLLFFAIYLISISVFGQDSTIYSADIEGVSIVRGTKNALYPKGNDTLRKLIAKKMKVEKIRSSEPVEICNLTFVIEVDGTMTNIEAISSNEVFREETIKALKKINETWIPGEVDGEKVRMRFKIPLTLTFDQNTKK